jgi:hypothetical protein
MTTKAGLFANLERAVDLLEALRNGEFEDEWWREVDDLVGYVHEARRELVPQKVEAEEL